MAIQSAAKISLEDAYLCLNCEVVTNSAGFCPSCGYKHLWPLEQWIGRVNGENSRYNCLNMDSQEQKALTDLRKGTAR